MATILLVLFFLLFPLYILHLCNRFRFFKKVGAVVVAYTFGMLIGNIGVLPHIQGAAATQELLTTLTIPLAIPLMLFSMDIKKWRLLAGKTTLSLIFALVAVVVTVCSGFFIFRASGIEKFWHVSGMLVGLYTGSTPNLAAIKIALGANETHYMIIAAYDLLIGAFHLLFLLTVAKSLFLTFLPKYSFIDPEMADMACATDEKPFWGLLSAKLLPAYLKAFGVAGLIFLLGGATTLIVPGSSQMAVAILTITSLGIVASLIPSIRKTERTFEMGMYLILIFCLVIASMADLRKMDFASVTLGGYVFWVVFGSMALQAVLSKFWRVDADTFMVTSTAFICNPAIVPVVAGSIKNRELVFPGITVGIIGYGIGNYLGIFISWFLERW